MWSSTFVKSFCVNIDVFFAGIWWFLLHPVSYSRGTLKLWTSSVIWKTPWNFINFNPIAVCLTATFCVEHMMYRCSVLAFWTSGFIILGLVSQASQSNKVSNNIIQSLMTPDSLHFGLVSSSFWPLPEQIAVNKPKMMPVCFLPSCLPALIPLGNRVFGHSRLDCQQWSLPCSMVKMSISRANLLSLPTCLKNMSRACTK